MDNNKQQMRKFAIWFYVFGMILCVLGGYRLYEFFYVLDTNTESLSFFFGTMLYMAYIVAGMMLIYTAIKARKRMDSDNEKQ